MNPSDQRVKAVYNMSTLALESKARHYLVLYPTYQAALSTIDPELTPGYAADLENAIAALYEAEANAGGKDEVSRLKVAADKALKEARDAVQMVFLMVERAMPDKKGRINAYGKSDYAKARASRPRMIVMMEEIVHNFADDAAVLDAVGYGAVRRADFGAKLAELKSAHTALTAVKKAITDHTNNCVRKQNELYAMLVKIRKAAAFGLPPSPEMQSMWRLYKHRSSKLKDFTMELQRGIGSVSHEIRQRLKPTQGLELRMTEGASGAKVLFKKEKRGPDEAILHEASLPAKGLLRLSFAEIGDEWRFIQIKPENSLGMRVKVKVKKMN